MWVVLLVGIALLTVGVTTQRALARRWRPRDKRSTTRPSEQSFRHVWFLDKQPGFFAAPGLTDRGTGRLVVDAANARATFGSKGRSPIIIENITSVSIGGRGTDFLRTWVEVRFDADLDEQVIFISDGRYLGWAPMLTGSNLRIASALSALIDSP
jgi:hypothetical protein